MVAFVGPQVFSQVIDPLREDRYLDFWGAGVRLMEAVLSNRGRLIGHA
jgi:hypothetical protein